MEALLGGNAFCELGLSNEVYEGPTKALSHHAVSCLWGDLSIWSETGGAGGGQ